MTIKEKLIQEIESTPETLLGCILNFVRSVKSSSIESFLVTPIPATTLLEFLEKTDGWQGNDFDECFHFVD
jgi:hypothetical protein